MVYTLRFVFLQNAVCFIVLTCFGSCIIHILYTGCAKIKKKIRRQNVMATNSHSDYACMLPQYPTGTTKLTP